MEKRRVKRVEIERRQCGIKIVKMEVEISYMKDDIKEIKEGLNEMRNDIKKLISKNSRLEGKTTIFGSISSMITRFVTIILPYLLRWK